MEQKRGIVSMEGEVNEPSIAVLGAASSTGSTSSHQSEVTPSSRINKGSFMNTDQQRLGMLQNKEHLYALRFMTKHPSYPS